MTAPIVEQDHAGGAPATTGSQFNGYAVCSRSGPHVTMQAGVLHAGRFWTTTSRSSLKARSVSAHGTATATIDDGGRVRILNGRTTALHPLQPLDAMADPIAPLRSLGAVLRLGAGHVRQLVGYLEAAGSIPTDWLPHRRVLLVTKPERTITLVGDEVVDSTGSWRSAGAMTAIAPQGDDDPHGALPIDRLPVTHRPMVAAAARAHVGVSTPTGPVALPARWLEGDRFQVSAPALVAIDAQLPGPASAVFDRSDSRRPDEKLGAMFRGTVRVVDLEGDRATLALQTSKLTTWDGFEASTVAIAR